MRFISVAILCWSYGYLVFILFEAPLISLSKHYVTKPEKKEFKDDEESIRDLNRNEEKPVAYGKLKTG